MRRAFELNGSLQLEEFVDTVLYCTDEHNTSRGEECLSEEVRCCRATATRPILCHQTVAELDLPQSPSMPTFWKARVACAASQLWVSVERLGQCESHWPGFTTLTCTVQAASLGSCSGRLTILGLEPSPSPPLSNYLLRDAGQAESVDGECIIDDSSTRRSGPSPA